MVKATTITITITTMPTLAAMGMQAYNQIRKQPIAATTKRNLNYSKSKLVLVKYLK